MKNYKSRTLVALAICFTAYFTLTASAPAVAQNPSPVSISGVVRFSEDNEVAAGVNIHLKGVTSQGTYTNANGQFEFPGTLKIGDVLVFTFIGRETMEYVVAGQPALPLQIVMVPDPIQMVEAPLVEGEERSAITRIFRRARNR